MMMPGTGSGISLRNLQTFYSFKNPVFRIYFSNVQCHMAGMSMQMVARSLLIYRLTDSATMLGLMSVAHALPTLLFSIFGGAIADRVQRKYVIIAGQAGQAVVALAVALALLYGHLSPTQPGSWWILIVASILQGTVVSLMMPSQQALLGDIVGQEKLLNAIALNNLGMNTIRLLAPALSGLFIDIFSFEAVYFTMTGLYVFGACLAMALPCTSITSREPQSTLADLQKGWNYLRHNTTVLLVLSLTVVIFLLATPYIFMMPVFTDSVWNVGATGMGILFSISGGGAIFGSIIMASLPNRKRGLILIVSTIGVCIGLIVFSFSSFWYLVMVAMVIIGVGQTAWMTSANSLLLYYADTEYRGRVMSIFTIQFGLTSFGTMLAGFLTDRIGVQWAIGGFAIFLLICLLLALVFVPRIRKLD